MYGKKHTLNRIINRNKWRSHMIADVNFLLLLIGRAPLNDFPLFCIVFLLFLFFQLLLVLRALNSHRSSSPSSPPSLSKLDPEPVASEDREERDPSIHHRTHSRSHRCLNWIHFLTLHNGILHQIQPQHLPRSLEPLPRFLIGNIVFFFGV